MIRTLETLSRRLRHFQGTLECAEIGEQGKERHHFGQQNDHGFLFRNEQADKFPDKRHSRSRVSVPRHLDG